MLQIAFQKFISLKILQKTSWLSCTVMVLGISFAKLAVSLNLAVHTPFSFDLLNLDATFYLMWGLWGIMSISIVFGNSLRSVAQRDISQTTLQEFQELNLFEKLVFFSEIIFGTGFVVSTFLSLTFI